MRDTSVWYRTNEKFTTKTMVRSHYPHPRSNHFANREVPGICGTIIKVFILKFLKK